MKKWFLICCVVVLGAALLCLAGCNGAKESERLLNKIQYYGRPGHLPNESISHFLDCSKIAGNSNSPLTLLGFQVGVTTYEEMIETLEYDEIYWEYNSGHLVIEEKEPWTDDSWAWIQACFLDGRLSAIQTWNPKDYPETIEDFVEEFGVPDLITWAGWLEERIAVWIELGLIGDFFENTGERRMIFLIPPMELSEFEGSWLSERIQYTPDYYIPEEEYSRWFLKEDPWGYTLNK